MKNILMLFLLSWSVVANAGSLHGKDYAQIIGSGIVGYMIGNNNSSVYQQHQTVSNDVIYRDEARIRQINRRMRSIQAELKDLQAEKRRIFNSY